MMLPGRCFWARAQRIDDPAFSLWQTTASGSSPGATRALNGAAQSFCIAAPAEGVSGGRQRSDHQAFRRKKCGRSRLDEPSDSPRLAASVSPCAWVLPIRRVSQLRSAIYEAKPGQP